MKNIEYIYCCITKNGKSNDTIYNYTANLIPEEFTFMKNMNALWVPGFNLQSFDVEKGLVVDKPNQVDKNVVGNAYFKSSDNNCYVVGYCAYRQNTDSIDNSTFRGKKYASHVILVNDIKGFAVEMIDSEVMKNNMLIEMNGSDTMYSDIELEQKKLRFPELNNIKGQTFKYDYQFFADNVNVIIPLLSNIIYAKENGKKLFINYRSKSNYETFIKLFKHAIELLPIEYANTIGFTINNGNILFNNTHFNVIAIYTEDKDIIQTLNGQDCFITLFSGEPLECKNIGFEKVFLDLCDDFDEKSIVNFCISYISARQCNDNLDKIEDFIKLVKSTFLALKQYEIDEDNPQKTLEDISNDLIFINENFNFIKQNGVSLHFNYSKIEEALRNIISFQNLDFNTLKSVFNLLLSLNDSGVYKSLFIIASSEVGYYEFLKTLCKTNNQDFLSYVKGAGWDEFYKIILKASEKTRIAEAVPLFLSLLNDFDSRKDFLSKQNAVNFIINNDNDGFGMMLDYELNKTDLSLNTKITNVINSILSLNNLSRDIYINKTYECLKAKIDFNCLVNTLTDLKKITKITGEANAIISSFLTKLLEETFSCGETFEDIHKCLSMYLSIASNEKDPLYSEGKLNIEDFLLNKVIVKIKKEDIDKLTFEYIGSTSGASAIALILDLTSKSFGNSNFKTINSALKTRLANYERYVEKVESEKKYTMIRVESILRSLKRLEDSKIIKILNQFGDVYKHIVDPFDQELKEKGIDPSSKNPKFYDCVDEFTKVLFGVSESKEEAVLKGELKSERKKEFAKAVDAELELVKKMDYATAATDFSASLLGIIILVAVFLTVSIVLTHILRTYYTNGSFIILLGIFTLITPISTFIFYLVNYKQKILHNAFVKTLWQSLIILAIVYGIAFMVFAL